MKISNKYFKYVTNIFIKWLPSRKFHIIHYTLYIYLGKWVVGTHRANKIQRNPFKKLFCNVHNISCKIDGGMVGMYNCIFYIYYVSCTILIYIKFRHILQI